MLDFIVLVFDNCLSFLLLTYFRQSYKSIFIASITIFFKSGKSIHWKFPEVQRSRKREETKTRQFRKYTLFFFTLLFCISYNIDRQLSSLSLSLANQSFIISAHVCFAANKRLLEIKSLILNVYSWVPPENSQCFEI